MPSNFAADLHRRRSIRLKGYDYAQHGAYFVTICARNRDCLFGRIADGAMRLNVLGETVHREWLRTAAVRPNVALDEFVVMPNHFHGIIVLTGDGDLGGRATQRVAPTGRPARLRSGSIGAIIGQFKSAVTKSIQAGSDGPGVALWQRGYYERIIRSEHELDRIREYIIQNPAKWAEDRYNPSIASTTHGM